MDKKTNIQVYTSYYAKMKTHNKLVDDVYIQISRTKPYWFKVDYNLGAEFGNYSEKLENYIDDLDKDNINILLEYFDSSNYDILDTENNNIRVFLLCYENTNNKPCHRILLKDYLNKNYNTNIKEWIG